jgi:hypothetical protein
MIRQTRLITQECPAAPLEWRWTAYWSDDTAFEHRGWGPTEDDAIEDLQRLDDERAEVEEANVSN